jgi:23S rRNA U2552 (ribose-2'-O)-methylase RlmE/FtsJ
MMETVVGVDLLKTPAIEGVKLIQGNITSAETKEKVLAFLKHEKADLVVSDAVPDFIGNKFIDHMQAVNLNRVVLQYCEQALRPGGNLLMKIIMGPNEEQLNNEALMLFESVQRVKPAASRQESAEIYFLCKNYDFSLNETAIKMKQLRQQVSSLENEQDNESNRQIYKEVESAYQTLLQDALNEAHK